MLVVALIYDAYTTSVEAQITRDIIALRNAYPRQEMSVTAPTQDPFNLLRAFNVPLVDVAEDTPQLYVVYKTLEFWPEHPDENVKRVVFRDLFCDDKAPSLTKGPASNFHVPPRQGRPIRDQLPLNRPAPRGKGPIDPALLLLWGGPTMASAATRLEAADSSGWFDSLSPKQQSDYLELHPNSKFAKQKRKEQREFDKQVKQSQDTLKKGIKDADKNLKKGIKDADKNLQKQLKQGEKDRKAIEKKPEPKPEPKPAAKPAPKKPVVRKPTPEQIGRAKALVTKHAETIKQLPKASQQFYAGGGTVPNSKLRHKAAHVVKSKSGAIVQALKDSGKEWKHGLTAIARFAARKPLSDHDKDAMKATMKDVVYLTVAVSLGGALGHGLLAFAAHFGQDLLQDVAIKSFSQGVVHGAVVEAGAKEDKMLKQLIEGLADFIAEADIPDSVWQKAMQSEVKAEQKKAKAKKPVTAAGFPFDVDHMNGPIRRDIPVGNTSALFGRYEEWRKEANRLNSELFDDNSEIVSSGSVEYYDCGAHWATWYKSSKKGTIMPMAELKKLAQKMK